MFVFSTYMQLRAARSRCRKLRPLRYSIPKAMSTMNFRSVWVGKNLEKKETHTVIRKLILFCLKSELFNTVCISVFGRNLTTGLSPRRERSRKLCRSPYFMNGRMTMGLGKCPESASKHTPKGNKSIHRDNPWMCNWIWTREESSRTLQYFKEVIHHSYQAVWWH